MTEAEHKITDKTITEMLVQHFKDDDVRFDKLTQIALQNGEHLSYFNKNLEEVKNLLSKIHDEAEDDRKSFNEHKARVEPAIKAHEKSLTIDEAVKNGMVKVGMWAAFISAIGTIGYAIVWALKKVL